MAESFTWMLPWQGCQFVFRRESVDGPQIGILFPDPMFGGGGVKLSDLNHRGLQKHSNEIFIIRRVKFILQV